MSIITPSIFIGEIAIPQSSNYFENGGNLQTFIDKYERRFLIDLLGVDFYADFKAGLEADPVDPKWIALRDNYGLKDMIANYTYYWWKRDETTQSMGISEGKAKAENATVTNSVDKQVRAWNEMVEEVRRFDLSTVTYPLWVRKWVRAGWPSCSYYSWGVNLPEIYRYQNSLNI